MTSRAIVQIDVTPTEAYAQRARLFEALEAAFPVRFREAGNGRSDGTVAFITGDADLQTMSGPTLALVEQRGSAGDHGFGAISFRHSDLLPRPFRGRTLTEATRGGVLPSSIADWGDVVATSSEGPVWAGRTELQHVAASWPVEPATGHTLREQLTAGRFMGMLPLVHFLQQLSARVSWEQPKSKACFVFDDPNLHWWSYGYFDYRKLSAHAKAHDYRVTAATIPLDQWYIHRATATFLRQQNSRISFAIHGNNHLPHELGRVEEHGPATSLAAQALRRTDAIQRAGLEIAPVMVPPFGVCSVAMLRGCMRAGFDALCADWPYWWLSGQNTVSPLSGWHPIDRLEGLPVIPRLHVVNSDLIEDLAFRAFLGQPLILYGHHTDLASGLDVLAARADEVRSLGVDTWESLGSIAQNVVSTHRTNDHLAVTLYSKSAVVSIPEGVSQAEFSLPGAEAHEVGLRLEICDAGRRREISLGERVPVEAGAVVAILTAESATPFASPTRVGGEVRAAVRRLLTECRDRAVPLSSKIGAR